MHCTSYARQASWLLAEVKRRQAPAPNIEGRDTVVLNDKHSSRPRPPVDELRKKAILVCLRNRILVDCDRMDMGEGTRNASSRSRVVQSSTKSSINQVFHQPSLPHSVIEDEGEMSSHLLAKSHKRKAKSPSLVKFCSVSRSCAGRGRVVTGDNEHVVAKSTTGSDRLTQPPCPPNSQPHQHWITECTQDMKIRV